MEDLLRGVSSLFEVTRPRAQADRRTLALLALIVVVGTVVRFWGLGNVGLHGDEKTMALPAMHLLQYGTPEMPSGFTYPRAVAQLYLMAGSALVFGHSEWALRLPSAVCGVLLILLTWLAGRRFLEPRWNLALTAAVALLPAFIADAQTARMYVFLVTGVTGFMALLFAWERTGRSGYLIGAVLEMAVSLEFHALSIFAVWLCLMPGLVSVEGRTIREQKRMLVQGAVAFVVIAAEYLALNHLISIAYPHALGDVAGTPINGPRAAAPPLHAAWPLIALLPALALSWYAIRERGRLPVLLLTASLVAQASRLDHVAILLIIAALVLARRNGTSAGVPPERLPAARLALYFAACVLLAAAQIGYLHAHRAGSLSQIVGLLLGWPSVRAYVAISRYSLAALLIAACGAAVALRRLARRQRVPDHMLFLALGVWLPLLQIGGFMWDPATRYVEGQVMPLFLVAFASAQWAARHLAVRAPGFASPLATRAGWSAAAAAIFCLLVIDPPRLQAAVSPTYADYPDHKGAAEFVRSQHLAPNDIIVAEDPLMQTYYLGHVDYWLQSRGMAAPFLVELRGRWVDEYTDTPVIASGAQLQRLVEDHDRGAIYVISGGEDPQYARLIRGSGIAEVLGSPAFHLIYVGRDHLTDVWRVDAPGHTLEAAVNAARGR